MKSGLIAIMLGLTAAVTFAENLLESADLSQFNERGIPLNYTVNSYIPRETGELLDAIEAVAPGSGTEEGAVELNLPDDRNLRLDLAKPIRLTPGRLYRLEVKLKWESLNPTGPGVESLGPCFAVYAHGQNSHVMALIKPSGGPDGWVTAQICFDLNRFPDMEQTRIFFRSHDVSGRLWLKDASLEEINELPSPAIRFLLPEGEVIGNSTLAL